MVENFAKLTPGERDVLRTVRQIQPCSQALLTAHLNLTQQSISRIVGSLSDQGLLEIGAASSAGRRGKPSPSLALKRSAAYAVGISIMADSVATGLIDFTGTLLGREVQTIPGMELSDVLITIGHQLDSLLAKRGLRRGNVIGAGVAMTGYFMGRERRFNPPQTLKHWMDIDVEGEIGRFLNLSTWADNDGNAAAIGEAALGVGRRYRNFAYLYFSAGFGGGVIIDGKLMPGRLGNSGEFAGVLPYNIYAHPNLESLRHCVSVRGTDLSSVHDLVTRFDPAWPGIDDWIAKVKDSLSLVASSCSAILDTEAIVLGGLMPRALAERIIPEIEFYSMPRWGVRRPVPEILAAEAPGEATLFGAASMPLEHLYF
jgi:predicted NBD/HSP70 family sugar kinase